MRRSIDSLQAGRGLAALAVVFHHAAQAGRDLGGADFPGRSVMLDGYLGVDFFFVLSGFIIYHSTVARGRSLQSYAAARFRRVYLPYWPLGIAIALYYVFNPAIHEWSWFPTLTLFPVDADTALSVAWTLKHEILFYLLFGLFYFSGLLPVGLVAWVIAIMLGPDNLPFRSLNLEFLFGIAACILYQKRLASPLLLLVAVVPLGLWIALGGNEADRLLIGLAFGLAVAPVAQLEAKSKFHVSKILVALGAASYSLYLVHPIVVSIILRLGVAIVPFGVAASLVAGFAYHFLVERRVIRRRANPEVFQG